MDRHELSENGDNDDCDCLIVTSDDDDDGDDDQNKEWWRVLMLFTFLDDIVRRSLWRKFIIGLDVVNFFNDVSIWFNKSTGELIIFVGDATVAATEDLSFIMIVADE